MQKLILASQSKYRKAQLEQLMIPFDCQTPLCNEDELKSNWLKPMERAQNLALAKAKSLLTNENQVIIGGDQLINFNEKILEKPGSFEVAIKQLSEMQGKTHFLITAVAILSLKRTEQILNVTEMKMKNLSFEQIKAYVSLDEPFDCAGSYKIEKHGISLFADIKTRDFTAIQGLPLIELVQSLKLFGIEGPYVSH